MNRDLSAFTTLLIIILMPCLALTVNSCKSSDSGVDSTWHDGVATLTHRALGKGTVSKFLYQHNDKNYEGSSKNLVEIYGYVKGEKYAVKISPKDPNIFFVLSWMPVFINNEKTVITIGRIERIFRFRYSFNKSSYLPTYGIRFSYTDSSRQYYERDQDLPPSYTPKHSTLDKGQLFEVEYLREYAKRSIIHLDKPANAIPALPAPSEPTAL